MIGKAGQSVLAGFLDLAIWYRSWGSAEGLCEPRAERGLSAWGLSYKCKHVGHPRNIGDNQNEKDDSSGNKNGAQCIPTSR